MIKAYEVDAPGRYDTATVYVEDTWWVESIDWKKHDDGNPFVGQWTSGLSIYADSDVPNPANDDFRKVQLVVTIRGFVPANGGTVELVCLDPPNESGTGAPNNDGLLKNLPPTITFASGGDVTQYVTVKVGQNAGDNYKVEATGGTEPVTVTTPEQLTVWRRLWLELDQMEEPDPT